MLVMRRREGESILIGEEIEIRILAIERSKVKIGIAAPREVPVTTREMELVRRENLAAARVSGEEARAVARQLKASTFVVPAENPAGTADVSREKAEPCRFSRSHSPG